MNGYTYTDVPACTVKVVPLLTVHTGVRKYPMYYPDPMYYRCTSESLRSYCIIQTIPVVT